MEFVDLEVEIRFRKSISGKMILQIKTCTVINKNGNRYEKWRDATEGEAKMILTEIAALKRKESESRGGS